MSFMKYLLILLLVLCSFSVFAQSDYYYMVNTDIDLKIPCNNEDMQQCSASALCNITINYPNQTNYVKNQAMTNQLAYHNYTMHDTSVLGEYTAFVNCVDGTDWGYNSFSFNINNLGSSNENLIYIMLIMMGLFIILSVTLTIFFYANGSAFRYLFLVLDFLFPTLLCYFAYLFPISMIASIADLFLVLAYVFGIITFLVIFMICAELSMYVLHMWKQDKEDEWNKVY